MRGFFGGNGFESRSLNSVSFEQGVQQAKNIITKKAVPYEKFEPIFGEESIRADKAHVANLKEQFKKGKQIDDYGSNCGTIFEAILHMRLEKGDWIDGVRATKPNEFDDFVHGIDEVVQIIHPETKKEEAVFAIDALTVGSGLLNVGIEKKMNRIENDIKMGHLSEIKYFFDEETGKIGIKDIPKVIIAAGTHTIQELNESWMEKDMDEIRRHPLQIQILEQIIEQSGIISSFAERNDRKEIAEKYRAIYTWAKKKLAERTRVMHSDWNDNGSSVISNALYPFKEIKTH